ncbi:unnamed protein product [Prunus brigantina]
MYGGDPGGSRREKYLNLLMDINMVMILPYEFLSPEGQVSYFNGYVYEGRPCSIPRSLENLLALALKEIIPMDGLNRHNHLKPLHIPPQVEETPLYKVFVDCGAMVNILPCSMMKKLSKMEKDLIPSGVTMRSFIGDKSNTK